MAPHLASSQEMADRILEDFSRLEHIDVHERLYYTNTQCKDDATAR